MEYSSMPSYAIRDLMMIMQALTRQDIDSAIAFIALLPFTELDDMLKGMSLVQGLIYQEQERPNRQRLSDDQLKTAIAALES
jgi:hypothetical protein